MKKITLVSILLLLTGCEDVKSKQWYKENIEEMQARYSECKKTGGDSKDCRNAIEAHYEWEQATAKVPDLNNI